MNKIFVALIVLGAGAGGFFTARHSTAKLTRETNSNRASWLVQTQQIATLQREQADLTERIRESKGSLARQPSPVENALWTALQTNRADRLPAELRQRIIEELGFNWQTSRDFIVVTKQALRDTDAWWLGKGKLSGVAASVFAMTPDESERFEAVIRQAQAEFSDWAQANVQRRKPNPERGLLANYFLPANPAMEKNIKANIAAGIRAVLRLDRAEFAENSLQMWMPENIGLGTKGATLLIWRELVGNVQRLKADKQAPGLGFPYGYVSQGYFPEFDFPKTFRSIFPNGWEDVAKREGFELPEEPKKN